MINKLISKTQVRLLEYDGSPSQDYKDGYCRAINDVLDLESIPTLGADEYEKFKADYENRLKADMVAMLEEIQLEIEEIKPLEPTDDEDWQYGCFHGLELMQDKCLKLIQQKINSLKREE